MVRILSILIGCGPDGKAGFSDLRGWIQKHFEAGRALDGASGRVSGPFQLCNQAGLES